MERLNEMINAKEAYELAEKSLKEAHSTPEFTYAIGRIEEMIKEEAGKGERSARASLAYLCESGTTFNWETPPRAVRQAVNDELLSNGYHYNEFNEDGEQMFAVTW